MNILVIHGFTYSWNITFVHIIYYENSLLLSFPSSSCGTSGWSFSGDGLPRLGSLAAGGRRGEVVVTII